MEKILFKEVCAGIRDQSDWIIRFSTPHCAGFCPIDPSVYRLPALLEYMEGIPSLKFPYVVASDKELQGYYFLLFRRIIQFSLVNERMVFASVHCESWHQRLEHMQV